MLRTIGRRGVGGPTGARVLRRAVRGQWRDVAAATVLLVGHQAGEALVPVTVGVLIDVAIGTGDRDALLVGLAALGLVFAVLSTCYRFGARRAWRADVHADRDLRLRLTDRILDARGGADAGRLSGDLVSVAVGDAKRVAVALFAIPDGIAALAALAVAAVALLRVSVPLGLLVLLGTPPLLVLVRLLGRPLQRRSRVEQEHAARAAGQAADLVSGIRVLKGLGIEAAATARYRATSRDALAATVHATAAQAGYGGGVLLVNGVFLALVALVGGRLAAAGTITVGELVAAVGLAQFLLGPLSVLGWVNGTLAQAGASAGRAAQLLAAPPAVAGGTGVPAAPVRGALTLRGIVLGAGPLDLDVAPGELLGVVSTEPAVATALARLLGREHDPATGSVELDGVSLRILDPAAVRAAVLVAAHDGDLFAGTVAENVAGGPDPGASLAAARVDTVLAELPHGAATAVGPRGRSLSGGQRQRVALARALAAGTPVLVLHDPTTAVDAVTEIRIAHGIRDARAGRTTVLLTTSPALLGVADRVVLLVDGVPVAQGRHADLLAGHPGYRAAVAP